MAATPRPSGGDSHGLPAVARRIRLGHKHTLLPIGIKPSLEAPVRLADIVQRSGAPDDINQIGRQADFSST